MTELEKMTAAFIETMFFVETNIDTSIPSGCALSEEARLDIAADCHSFWRRFHCYLPYVRPNGQTAEEMGSDFYYTRNGHGVGFWDTEWEPYCTMLTKGAQGYGEMNPYRGDDGLIYV